MTGCPAPSPQRTSVSRAGPGADRDGCQRVVAAAWAGDRRRICWVWPRVRSSRRHGGDEWGRRLLDS